MSNTTVLLFTRDLRVHDHRALADAASAERVVPLFVFDDALLDSDFISANRLAFLLDSLRDLKKSLRERDGNLFIRRGDVIEETVRVAREVDAETVFMSDDVSLYAKRRAERLRDVCSAHRIGLETRQTITVVPAGKVVPDDGDHYKVFTPYWRRWSNLDRRNRLSPPNRISVPDRLAVGRIPSIDSLIGSEPSAELPPGGEEEGLKRLDNFASTQLRYYTDRRDILAEDGTSRLSPYLHLGCVSPVEVLRRVDGLVGGEGLIRQLCWRDFYHQLLHANGDLPREDYRSRDREWVEDDEGLAAWREGQTGIPVIDAGMRQLLEEGWMHNRARMLVGSFLTKHLRIDWREGASHFFAHLVDGDLANNAGNWQWVAGTGTDTRPNRIFNPISQAKRFDGSGAYVRKYVPELQDLEDSDIHEPWKTPAKVRRSLDYPGPIADLEEAATTFREQVA